MDPEFADLVPLFVEEAKDRIERLATSLPRLENEPQAMVEAKRELHTIKGAGRMLQLGALAELCHAAEEVLAAGRPGFSRLLTRVVDALSAMIETVSRGGEPAIEPGLLDLLAGRVEEAAAPETPAAPHGPTAEPTPAVRPVPVAPASPVSPAPSGLPAIAGDIRVDAASLDAIAERATQVRIMALGAHPIVERIYDLARLAEEGLHDPQPAQVLAVLATMLRRVAVEIEGSQRRLIRSADEQLEKMLALQLQPLRGSLQSLARYARELARSLDREVEVEIAGEETRLDRRIARELDEALLHLVRNAVDHGIESPDVRLGRGKPRAGRIRIAASAEGARVRLRIEDDGFGIDTERVLLKAVKVGLIDAAAAPGMGQVDALRLLFAPGFSTRKDVSEISGRGVGLDVVASIVNRLGGEVFLEAREGQGTTVRVEVPVARRGELVMLVRVGQLRLALPAAAVRRALRFETRHVVERDGRTLARVGEHLERLVPFVPLARLYGQPIPERQILLEGVASGQTLAISVDDVLGEQEVLVRPITRSVATDRLLEGVALLASGEPVGVLSPNVLAQKEYMRAVPLAREVTLAKRVRVLLVDDSLVTREMERRLLEDAGFQVVAVGDADEALSRLGEESFDCVVTDIEMPGMDGFALTAHLRSIEHFAQLPIVVVSTRDRPEDRLRGLKAGADAYLTKQSLDAGELVDLVRRLGGR
ncbi:MAG TPA: response regulator [Thermoanaerobaculia bacterium]|nr:response regulator [Thermoanaerobaculia bacterium]